MHSFIQSRASVASRARAQSIDYSAVCVLFVCVYIYIYNCRAKRTSGFLANARRRVLRAICMQNCSYLCIVHRNCTEYMHIDCVFVGRVCATSRPPIQCALLSALDQTETRDARILLPFDSQREHSSTLCQSEYISHMVIIIAPRSFATFSRPGMGDAVAAVVQSRRTHTHTLTAVRIAPQSE